MFGIRAWSNGSTLFGAVHANHVSSIFLKLTTRYCGGNVAVDASIPPLALVLVLNFRAFPVGFVFTEICLRQRLSVHSDLAVSMFERCMIIINQFLVLVQITHEINVIHERNSIATE